MKSFSLDLGLERFENADSRNLIYLEGGVMIKAGDCFLTKYKIRSDKENPEYLGTYIYNIRQEIANSAQKLDRKDKIQFEIMNGAGTLFSQLKEKKKIS